MPTIKQEISKKSGQVNVMVEASTFDECQNAIQDIMEEAIWAEFTIPAMTANGCYIAIGHYPLRD